MATGFVDRFKGKVTLDAGAQWIAGTPLYGPASVQYLSTTGSPAGASTGLTINNYGVTVIASSRESTFTMAAPSYAGQFKLVLYSTINSTCYLRVSTAGAVTINASSFWWVRSTLGASVLEFIATSSINWAFAGLNNSSISHTLSTIST